MAAALLAAAPLAGLAFTVSAAEPADIRVEHAWSRATLAGRPGGVYLTVTDTGAPDRLTGAATPLAASAGLHRSMDQSGVSQMRPVSSIPVAPGRPAMLQPGGYHIMLMGLKQPLQQGEHFPLTLTFERAGSVTTTVVVARAGSNSDEDGSSMSGMSMGSSAVDRH
ncbi:MAG: copper chaperone PCu(A)C [Pseudomonadota bacterium]|nr:copper chaperone PCu(A)C [Pseudomonadota bacterium]